MTHELKVWLFDQPVGRLFLSNGRLHFAYLPEWLVQPQAMPVSMSLPLQSDSFDDQQARPFFAGLLPEGHLRSVIARQLQVSSQNEFALLDQLGGECAGAVSLTAWESISVQQSDPLAQFIHPAYVQSVEPLPITPDCSVQWLSEDDLVGILDQLPSRPMLVGQVGLRLSLAGAQDKLPVLFDGMRIGVPQFGTPSSHILKPAIAAVTDSVSNEAFCLALAKQLKLPCANAQIHQVAGRRFLLVERYDRQIHTVGTLSQRERLHQEDFCQALGVVSELKYQNEGGPNLAQCFALLRRATHPNAPQVLRLLDAVLFNALIGNHDAHGKNFSLLYGANGISLAPLYDLLCTAVYPNLTAKMAMKIGSKYKFSELETRHWQQFASEAGLSPAACQKRLIQMASQLPKVARALQHNAQAHKESHHDRLQDFSASPIVEQIVQLIEQRCALTLRRLG
ncbi:MAG: type II toxin-antitoxin system HipA family toxin [Moraxellaceae bacterium]